jgi:hypothetical protein
VWCFAHNQAQNLERWGQEGGRFLSASAPARLILPGLADEAELEALSRLLGRRREWVKTPTGGQLRDDPLMPAAQIRMLPDGHGLLVYRNAPPALVSLPTVWEQRKLRRAVEESMREFDAVLERGSVAAPTEMVAVEATTI